MGTYIHVYYAFFFYDGYSVPDRTGAAQYYYHIRIPDPIINVVAPPPQSAPIFFSRLIVTKACLSYKSALSLMVAELGRCLHL